MKQTKKLKKKNVNVALGSSPPFSEPEEDGEFFFVVDENNRGTWIFVPDKDRARLEKAAKTLCPVVH